MSAAATVIQSSVAAFARREDRIGDRPASPARGVALVALRVAGALSLCFPLALICLVTLALAGERAGAVVVGMSVLVANIPVTTLFCDDVYRRGRDVKDPEFWSQLLLGFGFVLAPWYYLHVVRGDPDVRADAG